MTTSEVGTVFHLAYPDAIDITEVACVKHDGKSEVGEEIEDTAGTVGCASPSCNVGGSRPA